MNRNNKLAAHYGNIERGLSLVTEFDKALDMPLVKIIPFSMQINLLNKCYQKCIGCRKPEWPDVKLQVKEVHDLLLWVASRKNHNTVVFSGGDPFAYPEFERVVRTAYNFDLGVGILTAGLWPRNFNYVEVAQMSRWISVSVDGATWQTYKKMRGVDTLKTVKRNIRKLTRYNSDVRINATISKDNFHEMAELIKLGWQLGVRSVNFFPIHTWEDLKLHNVEREQVLREVERAFEQSLVYPLDSDNVGEFEELMDRDPANVCIMPLSHCFVDANGDVFVCCRGANDNGDHSARYQDAIIGNIRKNSIYEVMASKQAQEVWKTTVNAGHEFCAGCDRYEAINHDYNSWRMNRKENVFL